MQNIDRPARIMISSEPSDESDDETLTKEERLKKKEFEFKRKLHYNEFQAIKLARKLLEEEETEETDAEENGEKSNNTTLKTKKTKETGRSSKDKMNDQ